MPNTNTSTQVMMARHLIHLIKDLEMWSFPGTTYEEIGFATVFVRAFEIGPISFRKLNLNNSTACAQYNQQYKRSVYVACLCMYIMIKEWKTITSCFWVSLITNGLMRKIVEKKFMFWYAVYEFCIYDWLNHEYMCVVCLTCILFVVSYSYMVIPYIMRNGGNSAGGCDSNQTYLWVIRYIRIPKWFHLILG